MIRVRNTHTASVGEIPAGAEGEVDEGNPGIRIFLAAGHLVAVGDEAVVAGETPATQGAHASLLAEIKHRGELLDDAYDRLRMQEDRHQEALAEAHEEATRRAEAEAGIAQRDGMITELHAENEGLRARLATLEAQLAAATLPPAPTPDAPADSAEKPKSKTRG